MVFVGMTLTSSNLQGQLLQLFSHVLSCTVVQQSRKHCVVFLRELHQLLQLQALEHSMRFLR